MVVRTEQKRKGSTLIKLALKNLYLLWDFQKWKKQAIARTEIETRNLNARKKIFPGHSDSIPQWKIQ